MSKYFVLIIILAQGFSSHAAKILQVKNNSAILELNNAEMQTLEPTPGQNIRLTFGNEQVNATVKKMAKNKLLIEVSGDISNQKVVSISKGGTGADSSKATTAKSAKYAKTAKSVKNEDASSKEWSIGVNTRYVVSGTASQTINGISSKVSYSGFVLSGIALYNWDNFGVGVDGEYALLQGKAGSVTSKITQIQFSLVGEYRLQKYSAGGLFTLGSNFNSTDSTNAENSLNGMGFGVFATYAFSPNIRLLLDYRNVDYKLDSATIKTSDIRLGAGYYF